MQEAGPVETNILAYLRVVGRARPDTIATRLRLSQKIAEQCVKTLLAADALTACARSVTLTPICRNLLPEVTAIEVKVDNWQRALSQAIRNRIFAHRSFIALPVGVAVRVYRAPALIRNGIGVIGIDGVGRVTVVKPAVSGRPKVWAYYYKLAVLVGQQVVRVQ